MSDARWMRSALSMARRTLGTTWPNPAVGCVIVRDGRVLARGATAPGGRPHAEAIALANAGECRGATAYVTLEPCAHHGRTPPCADALISAGIVRVVCPHEDPDPRVSGRGIQTLRDAGVDVVVGCLEAEARSLNAGFLSRIQLGRPQVSLKLATTLDGRIATRTGESRWITGALSRRAVHLIRAEADAVMVGAGTARTDDPMLDVRNIGLADRAPVRVVADGALSLPLTGKLVQTARTQPLWIFHRDGADVARIAALQDAGAELLPCATDDGVLRMDDALSQLSQRGIGNLMVEGGGRLAASLLRERLVDRLILFSAGKVIGNDGTPAVQGFGLNNLPDAPGFVLEDVMSSGPDICSFWRRA